MVRETNGLKWGKFLPEDWGSGPGGIEGELSSAHGCSTYGDPAQVSGEILCGDRKKRRPRFPLPVLERFLLFVRSDHVTLFLIRVVILATLQLY